MVIAATGCRRCARRVPDDVLVFALVVIVALVATVIVGRSWASVIASVRRCC
ncbi:hypothetical protein I553_7989 [Mycobacterium xenopi 4042]|uniref:Uncharacterized protein n=1 Tax=Mycobacterium xenopi 4042 TaxID=1299334 RepID=X8DB16_MYCXE|nr:hypothetical protein I553_7989 [Mycobacterium xenopi 4042]